MRRTSEEIDVAELKEWGARVGNFNEDQCEKSRSGEHCKDHWRECI